MCDGTHQAILDGEHAFIRVKVTASVQPALIPEHLGQDLAALIRGYLGSPQPGSAEWPDGLS